GGGRIRLTVGGTLELAGRITANGQNPAGGGAGSGGSIWITAGVLLGNGAISAIGGSEDGTTAHGAGGGGRIALYYGTNGFAGRVEACGGRRAHTGPVYAGAGTIWWEQTGSGIGLLDVQNCDN